MGILEDFVVPAALVEEGGEGLGPFGEDSPIFIQDRPEQAWMGELGKSLNGFGQLMEGVGLSGSLFEEEDVTGLVADQAEGVEVVKVHELRVVHV